MGYNTRQGKQHQLDEHVSLMEAQFADHFGAIDDQLMGLKETVSGISDLRASVDQLKDELPVVRQSLKELQQMMHELLHLKDGESSGSGLRQSKTGKGYEQPNQEYHYNTAHTPSPKLPKIEFPRFCGEDSYGWVRKAEKYFEFNPVDELYKVSFVSVHFDGQAEFWYGTYIKSRGRVSWFTFVKDLHARFSSLFRESIIGEFHKLKQTNTVEHYYNDFETLRSILVSEGSQFEENYFLQSFISGLKDDIRLEVEKFAVDDLSRAIYLARKQEASLNNVWHSPRTMTRTQPAPNNPSLIKSQTNNSHWKARTVQANPLAFNSQHTPAPPQKALLPTPNHAPTQKFNRGFFDERRKKGLCYWCDEVFTPAHSCKHRQVSMLVVDEEEEEDTLPIYDEEFALEKTIVEKEEDRLGKEAAAKAIKKWGHPKSKITHPISSSAPARASTCPAPTTSSPSKLLSLRPSVKRFMMYQHGQFYYAIEVLKTKQKGERKLPLMKMTV
ncbi:hypothetical protein RJ640_016265 [Escallonia rubra]|uniref:Ty3 transposon capsid-like protein domain-containing protein n=1 Tax=Escallonia rubra TaxID=112253 RepID=A0AA88U6F2_9ASTE|nr:hypothetical protein RJ640_016265 [Escallonia rubra]